MRATVFTTTSRKSHEISSSISNKPTNSTLIRPASSRTNNSLLPYRTWTPTSSLAQQTKEFNTSVQFSQRTRSRSRSGSATSSTEHNSFSTNQSQHDTTSQLNPWAVLASFGTLLLAEQREDEDRFSPSTAVTKEIIASDESDMIIDTIIDNGRSHWGLLPKREPSKASNFMLVSGVSVIPHPQKIEKGGEDASFTTPRAIGVADGVGGWNEVGIDPALYSRKLMEGSRDGILEILSQDSSATIDPLDVLWRGYRHAQDTVGSSTACIISIDGNMLRASNLGDSGFLIIRDNQVVFRTKEQQYTFNFPYQLGTGSECLPVHADSIAFEVQEGDVVIAGTDGLFDNMFDEEILEIHQKLPSSQDPAKTAEAIARTASELSQQWFRTSPFAKAAQQHGHPFVFGGKSDDITVIVAVITSPISTNSNTTTTPTILTPTDNTDSSTPITNTDNHDDDNDELPSPPSTN